VSATCKGCNAAIVWSTTEAGKAVPLNTPPEKRYIMIFPHDGSREYVKLVETWMSHFVTCPQAAEFRKK
jgi:hypothetical protein